MWQLFTNTHGIIVEKLYSSETVEQFVLFALYKVLVKLFFHRFTKCEHEKYLLFATILLHMCVFVVFNNVINVIENVVFQITRAKIPYKSLILDSWLDKIFWHLLFGKTHIHIFSSQYSLINMSFEPLPWVLVKYLQQFDKF